MPAPLDPHPGDDTLPPSESITEQNGFAAPLPPPDARFERRGFLGQGGSGEVWLVRDRALGRDVARKSLRRDRRNAIGEARFLREARVLARLEHPNIVPVYDLDAGGPDGPALSMRAVHGRTLAAELTAGRLPGLRERLEVLLRVCDAVGYAHSRRVIHRDLKPGNVMLGDHGEVLVVDWGLARVVDEVETPDGAGEGGETDPRLTQHGLVAGTPGYMAPEQSSEGLGAVGPAADVYALGAILHQLLTGRAPWEDTPWPAVLQRQAQGEVPRARAVDAGVPRELDEVAAKAMHPDPARRHPTVEALRGDLAAWLEGRPVASVAYTRGERLARWVRDHRRPLQWVGVLCLLAIAAGTAAQARANRDLQRARDDESAARGRAEVAEREALERLMEAQLAQAGSGEGLSPASELRLLLAARETAARLGRTDPAVETSLSLHAHRSPPATDRWPILTDQAPGGLRVSPSGERALAWGVDGEVVVFDPRTGGVQTRREHDGPVAATFDGEVARVAVLRDGRVEVGPLGGVPDHTLTVATNPPVDRIALEADHVDLIRLDHWFGRREGYSFDGVPREAPPDGIAIEPKQSDRWFWGRIRDGRPCLYDRLSRTCDPRRDPLSVDDLGFVQVAEDVALVATISAEMTLLELWDHGASAPRWRVPALGLPDGTFALGRSLHLGWGQSDVVDVRRVSDGRSVALLPVADPRHVVEIPGQDAVLVASGSGEVSRWDLPRTRGWEREAATWIPPVVASAGNPSEGIALHEGAARVAVAGSEGVSLFDLDLRPVPTGWRSGGAVCKRPAFSPDGALVAVACAGLGAVVIDVRDGRRIPIEGPEGPEIRVPAFPAAGVLGGWDDAGGWHTWELDSGRHLGVRPAHVGSPWDAVVTPEGVRVSTGRQAGDHTVRVEADGREPRVLPLGAAPFGVGFDVDSAWFWVGDATGTVHGWSLTDPTLARSFRAHEDLVLALDAAAGRIVTGSYEGRIRVNAADGRRLGDSGPMGGSVTGVALSADGTRVYYTLDHAVVGRYDLDRWAAIEAADAARRAQPGDRSAWAAAVALRRGPVGER